MKFKISKNPIKKLNDIKSQNNFIWEIEGINILSKINNKDSKKSELKKNIETLFLCQKLPSYLRLNFWLNLSGVKETMNLKENNNYYNNLVKAFNIMIKRKHPFYLYLEKKISLDLERSFNYEKYKITEENINQLKNILYAFSVRNVSINYCQGLNTIVVYLLETTNFREEESFYLFIKLLEDILPYDYYLMGIGIEAEMIIINKILKKFLPDLIKHLNKIEGDMILDTSLTSFISSLFIFKMDRNVTNFCMDCFYLLSRLGEKEDGDIFFYFYKIILAIFKCLKKDLMKCKDISQVNDVLKFETISKENLEIIIYYTFIGNEIASNLDYIKKIRKEEVDKIIKNKKMIFKFNNDNNIECNINYPICVEEKDNINSIDLYRIYKRGKKSKFIKQKKEENNSDDNNNKCIIKIDDDNLEENDEEILENIVIERRKHYCKNKNNF